MNKAQFAAELARATCSKKKAVAIVEATLAAIKKALLKGDAVTLVGFGTFGVKKEKPAQEGIPSQISSILNQNRRIRADK